MFFMVGTEDAFIRQPRMLSTENDIVRSDAFKRWLDKKAQTTTADLDEKTRALFTA
jgi:hypothetical protein